MSESIVDVDALVVGAGFGGIYQLKKLLDQGLNTEVIDIAGDVGGTWYWVGLLHLLSCITNLLSSISEYVPGRHV